MKVPVLFCLAAYVVGFIVGEFKANNRWEAETTERELSAAIARADQGKKDYAKLVEAQNQIASLRRDADRLDADLRSCLLYTSDAADDPD